MSTRLIFVSCGQRTADEKALGRRIKDEIDSTEGYEAYFADNVQNLSALGEHILDALRRCSGAVVLMHPRGRVLSYEGKDLGIRASVWINQELAILAYRQFYEGDEIPILAFKHESVNLEGAMTAFIVNPKPLVDVETIVREVRAWLTGDALRGKTNQQVVFDEKWAQLQPEDHLLLAALVAEGGQGVKEVSIWRRLIQHHDIQKDHASKIMRERRLFLSAQNLVQLRPNIYDGAEISLHPTWERYIRHALREGAKQQPVT
jgi:hypothetical protein